MAKGGICVTGDHGPARPRPIHTYLSGTPIGLVPWHSEGQGLLIPRNQNLSWEGPHAYRIAGVGKESPVGKAYGHVVQPEWATATDDGLDGR